VVRDPGLATVDARYYQDVTAAGAEIRFGLFRRQWKDTLFEPINPFGLPRRQVEYMTGNPSLVWTENVAQAYPVSPILGGQDDALRTFRAGERMRENWNAYPLHPGPDVNLAGGENLDATLPSASRDGNMLTLDVSPFGDNQNGHTGTGFSAGHYRVDYGGAQVAAGDAAAAATGAPDLDLRVRLRSKPGTVRFALSASRTGKAYPLSPRSQTVWTWRSAPEPRLTLPRGWRCGPSPASAPPPRHCAVQPMLTLRYRVAHLALDGSTAPGRQVLAITAGHLQLSRAAPISSVRARVSFDSGKSWQPASVTRRGDGRFDAVFAAAAGARVTLRVRAADAAGGSITETIDRAYRVAAASQAAGAF
jgi:hypothetical protein